MASVPLEMTRTSRKHETRNNPDYPISHPAVNPHTYTASTKYLLGVGVHEVRCFVGGNLEGVSLAGLLLRRLDRHARAKVDSPVRSLVLRLKT